ncbi:general stress protein [Lysobacter dokdonensis DS-58]|uniref:General stress protein n=1 Tax=Lysobacter dokdonensis DS-58 TaxID=1300345 RepID=A0A0A2WG33_9GAMM|nr:pyridoxamine 5'-phosphate oxidase family protein [Lysobacter dokdonensis]KGQ18743.1 general stress protein [Lysobacter dokdonensis DS-58]
MSTPHELEEKLWKALKSDRTIFVGLDGEGHARPLTALYEHERGPIWFFTAKDNALVQQLGDGGGRAVANFASKGHDLFACLSGALQVDIDRAVIDRLWNPFVAAWYEGKDDPKLALLRFDADDAEVWENANSMLAGVKMLVGIDPKKDYKDHVAKVDLH